MITKKRSVIIIGLFLIVGIIGIILILDSDSGRQMGDHTYKPVVDDPAYEQDKGPGVYIDEAHYNFHTVTGRYQPFARLLRKDGYRVLPLTEKFTAETLAKADILVISNALHKRNRSDWSLPTPSAFTPAEIEAVSQWVKNGGSLFLIADHMPLAGSSKALAAAFGFTFYNGFTFHEKSKGDAFFKREDQSLRSHKITKGRKPAETVDHVVTFMGQAFEFPKEAEPLLVFDAGYTQELPETAWEFTESTPKMKVEGFAQGAVMSYGKGKLAIFGEAAMFTSQLVGKGKIPFGMTSKIASQNPQFLLNIMHWLSGLL